MPTENQQKTDKLEILADIGYLNQANKREIKRIRDSIRQKIADTNGSDDVMESVIREVSNELGHLTANVKMTEKAISSLQKNHKLPSTPESDPKKEKNTPASSRFTADQLEGTRNLLPVESAADGDKFCWSSSEPEIMFSFAVDRREVMEMQIRLFCLIRADYAKRMKVFVDGKHTRHWHAPLGSKVVVGCRLPVGSNSTQTKIKIILPGTHSPSETSNSPDSRKLGIAINEIRFDKPIGALTRNLMRLRVKKSL